MVVDLGTVWEGDMTIELENSGVQRTRRNIMKMGAILVPATLGAANSASAGGPWAAAPFSPRFFRGAILPRRVRRTGAEAAPIVS
jgi:hypothetical protein